MVANFLINLPALNPTKRNSVKPRNVSSYKLAKYFFISCLLLIACRNNEKAAEKDVIENTIAPGSDTLDTQVINVWVDKITKRTYPLPDSIGNRPVSFYLEDSGVATIAKEFYKGQFRPEDNDTTAYLLSLVTTNDSTIRPFYRWCLDFTIQISDGALAEYPGKPALQYAIKFPLEFYSYMNKDNSGQRYKLWTGIISYSGLYDYTQKKYTIRYLIEYQMLVNCKECPADVVQFIKAFTEDITHDTNVDG